MTEVITTFENEESCYKQSTSIQTKLLFVIIIVQEEPKWLEKIKFI